jgi:hypothetical protein
MERRWVHVRIVKLFPQGLFSGTITAYEAPYWHVVYDDGDREDIDLAELKSLVTTTKWFAWLAETDLPDAFVCPCTLEVMEDPVVLVDGHTYERAFIVPWLALHATSPKTGLRVASTVVVANVALKQMIVEWKVCAAGTGAA